MSRNLFHDLAPETNFLGLFHDPEGQTPASLGNQELLLHFSNFIAAQLVWVDNSRNPWRQYICPLTLKSPCVLSAVLALASANLHVKLGTNSQRKAFALNLLEKYRRKTLDLLALYLMSARPASGDADKMDVESFQEALAATLLLWHLEMHFPSNSLWRLHLRAAQALIYHSRRSSMLLLGSNGCSDFLVSEFYCVTIWPRLTLNVEIDDMTLDLPLGHGTNAFLGFVHLMHRIILIASRSGGDIETVIDTGIRMSIAELESQAREIRQTVLDTQSVNVSIGASPDLTHVVDAWFYAILIFGYRTIKLPDGSDELVRVARDCLFESLSSLCSPLSFAQNQPWPLFIAGTECVGDTSRQLWVESRLLSLINFVCPLDRPQMLDFLKEWWARPSLVSDQAACWMEFKQERAKFGKEFVIW